MAYKAVLFDMDGVIVDSEPLHIAAFRTCLKKHGHNVTGGQYKKYFAGRTDEAGFRQYFDFVREAVSLPIVMDEKAKIYSALAADQLVPYVGVVDFIRALVANKVALGLVTGSLRAEAEVVLKTFELADLFQTIVAAEDITQSKPNPEGYLKGAKALGVDPADCIVIEDAPSGVKAAGAAGMRCLAVTTTHTKEELAGAALITDRLRPESIDFL